jgi:AraC-like DNA-binding protein
MKNVEVYCEPFNLEKGYEFEIHKVVYGKNEPYFCSMHFHEVHELIIFENIKGVYFHSHGTSHLSNNDVVFTPSLETHDFECEMGEKSWYILQFLPSFFDTREMQPFVETFAQGMHLRLSNEHVAAVQTQAKWLLEAYQDDPHSALSVSLMTTLILWIAKHARPVDSLSNALVSNDKSYAKLKPIIEHFRHKQSVELSLSQAAEMCFMSQAHFSRVFKGMFRYAYSEYRLRHKLYSAARLISQSNKSITEISYELNFSSPSHFITQFSKQFFITPNKYRKERRQTDSL